MTRWGLVFGGLVAGCLVSGGLSAGEAPEPSLGAGPATPHAAAVLANPHVPAASPGFSLLRVQAPGRFAIAAHSASGTAIELVDMITGPTPPAGAPGTADGRLDLLLDTGTYKIRTHPAAGARGDVALSVSPFGDAAPPAVLPLQTLFDATLTDLQQRAFWFVVTGTGPQPVRIEAAGRALADFRLWRDGRDLLATQAVESTIEPVHGHNLRDFLFDESLPPGTYLATAYGGPPIPWADGAKEMPFHLRTGTQETLRPGWVAGHIGPFGSELFSTAGSDDLVQLSMDGPATLIADGQEARIEKRSRVPRAQVRPPQQPAGHRIEIRGEAGAAFQLRSVSVGLPTEVTRPGDYWITANTIGLGGDEVPATLVLARGGPAGFSVAASNAPEIGPQSGWRRHFNLAGQVTMLFHAVTGGRIAATVNGVPAEAPALVALDGQTWVPPVGRGLLPPGTPASATVWDLAAGWYRLSLTPARHAAGVADVSVAPLGMQPPVGQAGPEAPSVSFGLQHVTWPERLTLFGNSAPLASYGMDARPLPLTANGAPLRVGQDTGGTAEIPLQPGRGTLAAIEIGVGPVPVSFDAAHHMARLPATGHARVVSLYWRGEPAPPPDPQPEPEASRPMLHDGAERFFNLQEGVPRSFGLDVGKGGLFRVETTGRLRTRGAVGTHFVPELQTARAHGTGQNMLLQGWLRAGRYRLDVAAEQSHGHAGVVAAPALLLGTPPLLPGGAVRKTLPAGSGLLVPIDIEKPGNYRLDLLGQARVFSARLEDAQGWPLAASAPLDTLTQELAPGHYRLLVMPEAVDADALARLTRIEPPAALTGHGPHELPFGQPQSYVWREPAGRNDPRQPDEWRFSLAAPADITLSVSEGMDAVVSGPAGQVAHLVGGTPFAGPLAQGNYRVEARSQGRNDRLDYTMALSSAELQPGLPRTVSLPAQVTFALADSRVVSLTSFGGAPVRAVLRDATGQVLGRYGAREGDWNVAISRPLPSGRYSLDLASAAPPAQQPAPANPNDGPQARAAADENAGETNEAGANTAGSDEAGANTAGSDEAGSNEAGSNEAGAGEAGPKEDGETPDTGDTADAPSPMQPPPGTEATPPAGDNAAELNARPDNPQTEITLALPDDAPSVTLAAGEAGLQGSGVHRVALPAAKAGQLILAGASSPAELILSLEQSDGPAWRSRALAQGLSPLLAFPADTRPGNWRLSVWPVDGGALPIHVAARVQNDPARLGQPLFAPAELPGWAEKLTVAHVALASPAVLNLTGDAGGVLAAAWPGHAASPPDGGQVAPQGNALWLVARHAVRLGLSPMPAGAPLTLTLPAGERASLPPIVGSPSAWIAEAQGQPGFAAPSGPETANGGMPAFGAAPGSAFALAPLGTAPQPQVQAASGEDVLRITLRPVALKQQAETTPGTDGSLSLTLPPASATPVALDAGLHTIRLDLAPGTAAIAGWLAPDAVVAWAGRDAVSRTIEGRWTKLLLVNTNASPAPVSAGTGASSGSQAATVIQPNRAFRRFFGAAGSLDLPVQASAGQTLVVAGSGSAMFVGAGGRIQTGRRLALRGPGRVILTHRAGLLAAWLEGPGAAPWPTPPPHPVSLPQTVALDGEAMRLRFDLAAPSLLRVRSTAPLILVPGDGPAALFPAGAAYSRYLPAGPATLLAVAAHDGKLSGSIELAATPVQPASEGLGRVSAVAPGDSVLFGFTLTTPGRVGIGVSAQPDRALLSLMDEHGHVLDRGAAMLLDLPAGRFILEARVPADAPTTLLRPALVGLRPRPNGPPPETVQYYRELAGLIASPGSATKDQAP